MGQQQGKGAEANTTTTTTAPPDANPSHHDTAEKAAPPPPPVEHMSAPNLEETLAHLWHGLSLLIAIK
ncbi:hypothetical protein Pelo_17558 [Pelomyxa schiedti]|nr:hypothetical protein Pelo_17558 [Pelomyxa schiedti]